MAIVFDGGVQASREICGACKSGVKEFPSTDIKIETGKNINILICKLKYFSLRLTQSLLLDKDTYSFILSIFNH